MVEKHKAQASQAWATMQNNKAQVGNERTRQASILMGDSD